MNVLTVDFKAHNAPELFARSINETGFGVIANHPINIHLVNETYQEWANFFNSDDKQQFLFNKNSQDGYFPFLSENAKNSQYKDLKEFFHFYPWGVFPETLSDKTKTLYQQMTSMAGELLNWLEASLPADVAAELSMPLSTMIQDSQRSLLRILHYPPLQGSEEEGAIRATAHEDINLITLLPAATAPGLQVQDKGGNWHAVSCDPGTIVVNAADMLQLATKGYFKSTTHRVINPIGELAKQSRFSMPLFLHPRDEVKLSEDLTATEYRLQRLREIGLL